ncbi:hypothetical protein Smic_46040 [Streptomyces microflavus]|uniref:HTH tetR-type domain-containing protein n=1 Tax=Streptomyces microflavus TaxID=1919 RepID=A0A7J0CUH1_STRMI|nr:hypothetical protein Smic_46040 [Streptomyces microflavus]
MTLTPDPYVRVKPKVNRAGQKKRFGLTVFRRTGVARHSGGPRGEHNGAAVRAEVPRPSPAPCAEGGPVADGWAVQRTGPGDQARTQAREQLLDAARELYGVVGYRETSETDLCEAAGVTPEVLRQEYGTREGLLIALHNRVTTIGLRAMEAVLHSEGIDECSIADRVRRLFDAYVESVTRDPREARVTFVEVLGVSAVVDEHCKLWRALWTEFLTGRPSGRWSGGRRRTGTTASTSW